MTVMPMAFVNAPPQTPPAYGILSAAVVVDSTDPHGAFGFEYIPDFCGAAALSVAVCVDGADKVANEGRDLVVGQPFTVYSLHTCKAVAFDDAQGRASRALTAGEGRGVEEWLGTRLTAEADDNNGTWSEATTVDALAAAEHYIHCNYGGVGTIHLNRGTASGLLTDDALVTDNSGRLFTKLGNRVSAGCYDVSGGDTVWATGTVMLQRGRVFSPPDPVLDPKTNDLFALAERAYSGAWECFAIAVHVGSTP